MLLLALAYALILEGFTNQTLFNPNYAGQRLLDYGFIPALGTSFNFTVYVLTLHVVWSVGSSVALAEGLAGARWREPWLRLPGLIVTTALLLLGCAATTIFTLRTFHFVASVGQFAAVAVFVLVVIVAAFAGFRGRPQRHRPGSASGESGEMPAVRRPSGSCWSRRSCCPARSSVVRLRADASAECGAGPGRIAVASRLRPSCCSWSWSRRAGWGPVHALAASTGAILTYGWISLRRLVVAGGTSLGVPTTPIDVVGQAVSAARDARVELPGVAVASARPRTVTGSLAFVPDPKGCRVYSRGFEFHR